MLFTKYIYVTNRILKVFIDDDEDLIDEDSQESCDQNHLNLDLSLLNLR